MKYSEVTIPKPTKSEVERYLQKWESLENYTLQESALDKLFHKTYKGNTDLDDILIKVCALNDFYSTNIYSVFNVAKRIKELDIDKRLKEGDVNLVNDIARVTISGKPKNFYSFASKYCSHHHPIAYPIYDSYVEKCLVYFKRKDKFAKFTLPDLRDYQKFKDILTEFKKFYGIDEHNLKDIDKYLWQLGKEYLPNKY
jgi:hypothetical protein